MRRLDFSGTVKKLRIVIGLGEDVPLLYNYKTEEPPTEICHRSRGNGLSLLASDNHKFQTLLIDRSSPFEGRLQEQRVSTRVSKVVDDEIPLVVAETRLLYILVTSFYSILPSTTLQSTILHS